MKNKTLIAAILNIGYDTMADPDQFLHDHAVSLCKKCGDDPDAEVSIVVKSGLEEGLFNVDARVESP